MKTAFNKAIDYFPAIKKSYIENFWTNRQKALQVLKEDEGEAFIKFINDSNLVDIQLS
jgi:hypothetical protein